MGVEIFDILNQLDKRDGRVANTTDEATAKEISTFLRFPALRWMSAAISNEDHAKTLARVNSANVVWWSIKTAPMQAALLASAGLGRAVRHKWIAPPKGGANEPLFEFVRMLEPDTDRQECTMFLNASSDEVLISLALRSGQYDTQSLSDFKKALKTWRKKHPR